jgi:cell wall-associated NlpC family hydrolase
MLRLLVSAVCLFPALAAPALAAEGYAEVLSPAGKVVAAWSSTALDYPGDGSLVHVGSAAVGPDAVVLREVTLLGGRIAATELSVPRHGSEIRIAGLVVDGRYASARPNTLVPLGSSGYLVVAQGAVSSSGALGLVGLRLVVQDASLGVPTGTQVLVGLPYAPRPAGRRSPADVLAVLGFTNGAAAVPGFVPAPKLASSSLGAQVAAIAERYLGVPYVWAGADPLVGFDCSGLTKFVYAQVGIRLTHYSGAQWNQGAPVPRDRLAPGDLVFFHPSSRGPQHVGIYLGNDEFVQAPHTGDVVKISSLGEPRYGLSYVGAVRPYAS